MNILIATPVYPPEISRPSAYVKDLATRLATDHNVTVLTYGRVAEPSDQVTIYTVDKQRSLLHRTGRYLSQLWQHSKHADLVFAHESIVASLPAIIVARLRGLPVIYNYVTDERTMRVNYAQVSRRHSLRTWVFALAQWLALRLASRTMYANQAYGPAAGSRGLHNPLPARRPPQLPFASGQTAAVFVGVAAEADQSQVDAVLQQHASQSIVVFKTGQGPHDSCATVQAANCRELVEPTWAELWWEMSRARQIELVGTGFGIERLQAVVALLAADDPQAVVDGQWEEHVRAIVDNAQ